MSDILDIYPVHGMDAKIVILERGGHYLTGKVIDPYSPLEAEDFATAEDYRKYIFACEDVAFTFTQKWDGCQNISFKNEYHTCSNNDCDDLATILKVIRYVGNIYFTKDGE
jgi:hypothetical protein